MVSQPMYPLGPVFPTPKDRCISPAVCSSKSKDSFLNAMLETPLSKFERRNPLEWLASLILHILVLSAFMVIPLYFTDTIDVKAFTQTLLVGPPPPAPPPPAATVQRVVKAPLSRFMQGGKLMAPTAVPKRIAIIKESPLPPSSGDDGVIGGVPGGIPGGQVDGVLGGIIGGTGRTAIPVLPAAPPPVKRILRVGGNVKPPHPIYTPSPEYPTIAKLAKVQGVVEIEAVINEHGDVVSAHVVSGPPLLIGAALQTVTSWRYEPTLLNGEPVSVQMGVKVNFALN